MGVASTPTRISFQQRTNKKKEQAWQCFSRVFSVLLASIAVVVVD
jgi:hypothetical protein